MLQPKARVGFHASTQPTKMVKVLIHERWVVLSLNPTYENGEGIDC
ncbi:MAG: hypothetical protein RLZZ86_849 [Cyanobacteriota bacterium]